MHSTTSTSSITMILTLNPILTLNLHVFNPKHKLEQFVWTCPQFAHCSHIANEFIVVLTTSQIQEHTHGYNKIVI